MRPKVSIERASAADRMDGYFTVNARVYAITSLIVGGVALGLAPFFVRASELDSTVTAFYRVAIAAVCFVGLSMVMAGPSTRAPREGPSVWLKVLLPLSGVLFAADVALMHMSIVATSVANATVLTNIAPVFVGIFVWIFQGRKPGRVFLVATTLSVLGVFLMIEGNSLAGEEVKFGDFLGLMAAVFYALYIMAVKSLRSAYSPLVIMAWSSAVSAVALAPVLWMHSDVVPIELVGWMIVIGLALISHVGGQGLITVSLKFLPVEAASVLLLVQPLVVFALSGILVAEPITPWQLAGGALTLSGIYMVIKSQSR